MPFVKTKEMLQGKEDGTSLRKVSDTLCRPGDTKSRPLLIEVKDENHQHQRRTHIPFGKTQVVGIEPSWKANPMKNYVEAKMIKRSSEAIVEQATGGTGGLPICRTDAKVATGFDFEPLPNGDVLIQFFGNDGITFNNQIMTRECVTKLPVVVHAFFLAVDKGSDEALDFLNSMNLDFLNTEEGQL